MQAMKYAYSCCISRCILKPLTPSVEKGQRGHSSQPGFTSSAFTLSGSGLVLMPLPSSFFREHVTFTWAICSMFSKSLTSFLVLTCWPCLCLFLCSDRCPGHPVTKLHLSHLRSFTWSCVTLTCRSMLFWLANEHLHVGHSCQVRSALCIFLCT